MPENSVKSVVVLGGGWAGTLIARDLSAKLDPSAYDITLINDRPYFVHIIAGARLTVTAEGKLEDKVLIPFDRLFHNGNGTAKIGTVASVVENDKGQGGVVVLDGGERVPYTALIIATGNSWAGPMDFPKTDVEVRAHISSWRDKYEKATHVVIVGGGPLGLETAGEVKETWPNKKVTVVHHREQLVNDTWPEKYRNDVERRWRRFGINFILGDKLDIPPDGTIGVTTHKGKHIPDADLVIPAFGSRPNAGFLKLFDEKVLDDYGAICVNDHFELPGHPGVFAAGDVTDRKETKQASKAHRHVPIVVANVVSFLRGEPCDHGYTGVPESIVITLGKNGGSGYFNVLWGIMIGNWLSKWLVAKHLGINGSRRLRGY
ncbi:FAD/NAD-P-binding domain-containing protein [Lenzites betulinus]|nr:FAD/NAD-P-binding domain-containing protein [Lenzites betulinus]